MDVILISKSINRIEILRSDPNVMNLIESIILPIGWKMSAICAKITFHVVYWEKRGYICMSKLRHTQFHTLEWDAFKTFYRKQTTVIIFTQVIFGTWNIFPLHLQFHTEMSTLSITIKSYFHSENVIYNFQAMFYNKMICKSI